MDFIFLGNILSYCGLMLCNPVTFNFAGQSWVLPLTVQEAVVSYDLKYIPPGYYYKTDSDELKIILGYHSEPLDFKNEYQPKETLFSRKVHSYVFQFKDKEGLYDSLRNNLEKSYRKEFILTKGLKTLPKGLIPRDQAILEPMRPFEHSLMTVDNCLTIGINRRKLEKIGNVVTIQFLYDLPLGDIGLQMGGC